MKTMTTSEKIYHELSDVIPGGVNSPARAWRGLQDCPLVAQSGKGAEITDAEGNVYIDYCMSWGALIHGHCAIFVQEAAIHSIYQGSSFGMTTEIEGKLAKKVCASVSSVEQVRFVNSGTEATMSAARLARAFTGKKYLIKFTGHYHGHADFFLVQAGSGVAGLTPTSSSAGVPEEVVEHTICLPFNDLGAVETFFKEDSRARDLAAVILEPVACNMGVVPTARELMRLVRQETEKVGALLIFDEVITGFRCSPQGAQSIYEEIPDLTCFGKIVGGGFPAAAFGGRKEVMQWLAPQGPVYQAGTLSGNPVAMAAGMAALEPLQDDGFYRALEEKTRIITDPVKEYICEKGLNCHLNQVGSLFTLFLGKRSIQNFQDVQQCDQELFKNLFHFMMKKGILMSPSQFEANFISMAHSKEQLEKTRDGILEFLSLLPQFVI